MAHHANVNDLLLPFIREIETNILKTDLESLDSDIIIASQHKLYTIISRLNVVRNSRAPINKLIPDILHDIFEYAISTSVRYNVMKTALNISRVCHRWRRYTLEWPTLWRFIESNSSLFDIKLFLCRSKNAPLEFLVNRLPFYTLPELSPESYANRLRCLSLRLPPYEIHEYEARQIFHIPGINPLQLRRLDIKTINSRVQNTALSLVDFIRLDVSFLQSLSLGGMDLPFLELPPNNVLTRFIFRSANPPSLPRLLVFLSSCPLLRELELDMTFQFYDPKTETCPRSVNRLDFPKLERFVFVAHLSTDSFSDLLRFDYLRELSACIGTMGQLSYFSLHYDDFHHWYDPDSTILPPLNILGLVPREIFCHFSNHVYLSIRTDLGSDLNAFKGGNFQISSALVSYDILSSSRALQLTGSWGPGQPFHHSIFELIHAMPIITYLRLANDAFKCLISWNLDFHNAFRCVNTLEFDSSPVINEDLKSLPTKFPKLRRLIISIDDNIALDVLLDAVSKAGVETLELLDWNTIRYDLEEVFAALRDAGVTVILPH